MQSTEFKLLRLFYYNLRKYLGGQSGDGRVLSRAINALARTGTILSSYLRNRNRGSEFRIFLDSILLIVFIPLVFRFPRLISMSFRTFYSYLSVFYYHSIHYTSAYPYLISFVSTCIHASVLVLCLFV